MARRRWRRSSRISQKKQTEDIRKVAGVRARSRGFGDRSQHLSVQPRPSAGLRRHQHLHEGALLRGHPQGRRLRGGLCRRAVQFGHDLPAGNALRSAGGAPHLGALRRLLVRRRRRYLRGARLLRRGRHLRHPRQYREDLRPGDQGGLAYLHVGRVSHHLRRRSQPRLSQCPGDRAAYRRQCRHHPHRPPYRYPGEGYG